MPTQAWRIAPPGAMLISALGRRLLPVFAKLETALSEVTPSMAFFGPGMQWLTGDAVAGPENRHHV